MKAYFGMTGLLIESIDDAVRSVKRDPGCKVTRFENGDITGASKTSTPLPNTWAMTTRTRRRRSSCGSSEANRVGAGFAAERV